MGGQSNRWRCLRLAGWLAAQGAAGCTVGSSILVPSGEGGAADASADALRDAGMDARAEAGGPSTCSGALQCTSSCGPTDFACVQACGGALQGASQALYTDLLSCFTSACDASLTSMCFGTVASGMGACSTRATACAADGSPLDAGGSE